MVPKKTRPGGQPKQWHKGKRGLHLERKTGCGVSRMKNGTCLAVATFGLFGGSGSPVKVYAALRAGGRSTVCTGPGLWGRQGQLLGYHNNQRS